MNFRRPWHMDQEETVVRVHREVTEKHSQHLSAKRRSLESRVDMTEIYY